MAFYEGWVIVSRSLLSSESRPPPALCNIARLDVVRAHIQSHSNEVTVNRDADLAGSFVLHDVKKEIIVVGGK